MTLDKIKRPPNSWIIFLREKTPELKKKGYVNRLDLIREAALLWKALPGQERASYDRKQLEARKWHHIQYPAYKYVPRKSK